MKFTLFLQEARTVQDNSGNILIMLAIHDRMVVVPKFHSDMFFFVLQNVSKLKMLTRY